MRGFTSGCLLVCLGGGVAGASPFVMMDRQDDTSMAGGELMYTFTDSDRLDATLIRFDAHFQYVTAGGIGVYGTLPIAYGAADNVDSITTIGDLDVGGIYNARVNPETTVVLHGGITLPTASDSADDISVGILAGELRIHDTYQWAPKATSLRLAASPVYHSGKLFLRADVGLDVNLDAADPFDPHNALHINAAVGGFLSPQFVLSGELISLTDLEGDDNNNNDIELALTGRYYAGGVSPYFGLVVPTDSDVSDVLKAALVIGLDAKI